MHFTDLNDSNNTDNNGMMTPNVTATVGTLTAAAKRMKTATLALVVAVIAIGLAVLTPVHIFFSKHSIQ